MFSWILLAMTFEQILTGLAGLAFFILVMMRLTSPNRPSRKQEREAFEAKITQLNNENQSLRNELSTQATKLIEQQKNLTESTSLVETTARQHADQIKELQSSHANNEKIIKENQTTIFQLNKTIAILSEVKPEVVPAPVGKFFPVPELDGYWREDTARGDFKAGVSVYEFSVEANTATFTVSDEPAALQRLNREAHALARTCVSASPPTPASRWVRTLEAGQAQKDKTGNWVVLRKAKVEFLA